MDLTAVLDGLIAGGEDEVVEFKAARTQFDTNKTGKYVSALSNEANLRGLRSAWLVFGVSNSGRVVGTSHLTSVEQQQKLQLDVQESINQALTVRKMFELEHHGARVVMLEIPPAPRGMPISWKGQYWARAGESLVPLSIDKQDEIRNQTLAMDWSAALLPDATIGHLSPEALAQGRAGFLAAHRSRFTEADIASWSEEAFLDKLRLRRDGKLTRAAVLLLGRPESASLLSPLMAEMTWKLVGQEQAYEHFGLPFILSTTALYGRIRNVQLRLLPPGELLWREVPKYDQESVLEALHNCIAHQDYRRHARIVAIERPDRLVFVSQGQFFEGEPDDYALGNRVPTRYRNPLLASAMTELNMVDRLGAGIERLNRSQARRYLPLPDYDVDSHPDEASVTLTLYGGSVDEAYTNMLLSHTDLPFEDVLALDRVQKRRPIADSALARLRKAGLVEGRKPHVFVSAAVAAATGEEAAYVRSSPLDHEHFRILIEQYLTKFGVGTRQDFDQLLRDKLSDLLSDEQKTSKIHNLLTKFRREGLISSTGRGHSARWVLSKVTEETDRSP